MTTETLKLKDLKAGDWFTKKNTGNDCFKVTSLNSFADMVKVEYNGELYDIPKSIEVSKIDGFQLYLLQGGRTWD